MGLERSLSAGEIVGLPEMPIEAVVLENVRINAKVGMIVQDARNVSLQRVRIIPEKGEPFTVVSAEVVGKE